jgi:hypothetical protein
MARSTPLRRYSGIPVAAGDREALKADVVSGEVDAAHWHVIGSGDGVGAVGWAA